MISIATSYKNRKPQFTRTLKTIANSSIKDVEVIVVDDASDEQHRLEDLIPQFPFLKVIRVEPHEKWYVNPCVAFNKAFAAATGDKIIIQNPECLHFGDVLKYTDEHLTDETYLSFAAFSLGEQSTDRLDLYDYCNMDKAVLMPIASVARPVTKEGDQAWYNHSKYRPVGYHFCAAITRKNLNAMGGFDERFALGLCFDDDEFLNRVRRSKLEVKIIDEPFVLHQWHYSSTVYQLSNSNELVSINRNLFAKTKNELQINPNNGWKFNIPKILHVYWDLSALSYLQLLTLKTFIHYNPTWSIRIHCPKHRFTGSNTWNTLEQKIKYIGPDYTEEMFGLPNLTVEYVDVSDFGFSNDLPEVFKSDIIRWHLLSKHGGCWSDMDILYTKPIDTLNVEGTMIVGTCENIDTAICLRSDTLSPTGVVHAIGFYLSSTNNAFFNKTAQSLQQYFNPSNYQSVGSRMLMSLFPNEHSVRQQFQTSSICNLPSDVVYPFSDRQIDQLFKSTNHNMISSLYNWRALVQWVDDGESIRQ